MVTDVAHIGRPQQGITDGMYQHVGIAVSQQAFLVLQTDTTQPQLTAFHQLVDIEAETYTYFHIGKWRMDY